MTDAGQIDFEHNLITSDEEWYKNTGDAIAAQLREAGFKVKRTVLPGSTFWNDWTKYPYSMTDWNMRPLGVQVLALAYRTGEAWNETAYSNPEFDAKLEKALAIPDPNDRKVLMADLEQILQDSGVIIQPYWLSLFNHATPQVKNYGMHPTYESQRRGRMAERVTGRCRPLPSFGRAGWGASRRADHEPRVSRGEAAAPTRSLDSGTAGP